MRAVITRVKSASVEIDGSIYSSIGDGLLVLLGVHQEDTEAEALKIADKLCAYIKTLTEEAAGNKDFVSARKTLEKTLNAIDSEELTFFRENLLTAFTLTIDEM